MSALAALLLRVMLVLLPAFSSSTDVTPDCTHGNFQGCLESLQSLDLDNAATRSELMAICSTLKESTLQCVDDHMRHCFNPTQRKVFNQVVAGARQVLSELCVPGPIQEAYLRHAPCFRNASLQENKCALKYRQLMELSSNVEEKKDVDEGLRESCCAFREFVLCKHFHATQDCGMEAGEFQQQHLDRISSPLIHEHCASYTYGTNTCSRSWTLRAGLWIGPLALLSLASLWKFFQTDIT